MTRYLLKFLISAAVIVVVSEISKRNTLIGGLIASLPLTSMLAILWFYTDTRDTGNVASLSMSILWFVIPSLVFFITLSLLLKKTSIGFYPSFILSTLLTMLSYYIFGKIAGL
ncbi:MAG: hypothetical protein PWP37_1604 [Thermotogota bacterium]|nr:hypothetical protein [Thermotogota bacterium]MDK2865412.1 hypothetical protein [Thermotogota bacterium]HCZ06704.1 hypothetical protein [Thermotogota bacterium]